MGTLPISPTVYKIRPGEKYDEIIAQPTWCNPDAMPRGYQSFFSYQLGGCLLVGFNPDTLVADTYELQSAEKGLAKQVSTTLQSPYTFLSAATFYGDNIVMGYDSASGKFDFYAISQDLSINILNTYQGPKDLTAATLFNYHEHLYFSGYNGKTGEMMYAEVVRGHGQIEFKKLWKGNVGNKGPHALFFQMGMENFVLRPCASRVGSSIDHVMDDPARGQIIVGERLPLVNDKFIDTMLCFDGSIYFATYNPANGAAEINRVHSKCKGWHASHSFKTFDEGVAVTPMYLSGESFLLYY